MMILHDTQALENLNLIECCRIHITRRIFKEYFFYMSIMQICFSKIHLESWTVTVVCVILQQAGISPGIPRIGTGIPVPIPGNRAVGLTHWLPRDFSVLLM